MMCAEMPYNSNFTYTKPYILEAMKIAQDEGYNQAIDDAIENVEIDTYHGSVLILQTVNKNSILKLKK